MWEFLTFLPDDSDSRAAPGPSKEPAAPREDAHSVEQPPALVEPPAFLKQGARQAPNADEREDPASPDAETLDYVRFLDEAADAQREAERSKDAGADHSDLSAD